MKNTLMIKDNNVFARVMKKGEWYSGDLMSLYLIKNKEKSSENVNMLGIAVSKKFSKSSVKRNKVRRLIKEVYRLNENNIKTSYFMIFLWKNSAEYSKVTFYNIKNDFYKCMSKANLFINKE